MPVILAPADYASWLHEGGNELLRPYPPEEMRALEVGTYVNKPGHEGARCIEPINPA